MERLNNTYILIISCAASSSKSTEYRLDLLARQEAKWTRGHAGWDR